MGLLHLAIPERTLDGNFRWDTVPGFGCKLPADLLGGRETKWGAWDGVYMLGNSTHGVLDPGSGVVDTLISRPRFLYQRYILPSYIHNNHASVRDRPPRRPAGHGHGAGHGTDHAVLGLLQAELRVAGQGLVDAGGDVRQVGQPAQRRRRDQVRVRQRRQRLHVLEPQPLGCQRRPRVRLGRRQHRRQLRVAVVLRLLRADLHQRARLGQEDDRAGDQHGRRPGEQPL